MPTGPEMKMAVNESAGKLDAALAAWDRLTPVAQLQFYTAAQYFTRLTCVPIQHVSPTRATEVVLPKKGCAGCGAKAVHKEIPAMPVPTPAPVTTRPSCLLCAEKHIGAALVKAEEVQFGYRYRLLIVGHLNEAEEETITEFPALAEKIRAARLVFQDTKVLDLAVAVQELETLRTAPEQAKTP